MTETRAYAPPTPEEIRALLRSMGLSGADAAALVGLSDGRQIRKYTGGSDPRRMPFATLYTLLHRGRDLAVSPDRWREQANRLLSDER